MTQANRFDDVVRSFLTRRAVLIGGAALPVATLATLENLGCATAPPGGAAVGTPSPLESKARPLLGFEGVPISREDKVLLPDGYTWHVVNAWGDPIVRGGPAFHRDASQSAADQAKQAGMFHDGAAFFPFPGQTPEESLHGLVAINFEYTDDNLLTSDGMATWTAEKVQKSKNAHGVGILEVRFESGAWKVLADSSYGRRITADTPMRLSGPAAGHAWMKTAADPTGTKVLGTFNNCAAGRTPWGTYLTCEENVTPYFVNESPTIPRLHARYGVPALKDGWGFRWQEFDERFDAGKHPNEPNRHGWVVEIDPFDPRAIPVKRTALGRMAHEGATLTLAKDGRVVLYMGDDDFRSKFEHIYKFVSRRPWSPGGPTTNRDLLDDGILYAAKFDADGTGAWIELVHGRNGLTAANGFASQAEVLIDARTAADVAGATYMDRPEWAAVHPQTGEVYVTLSNNSARGVGKPFGANAPLGPDAANPRAPNPMGHIIRWRETAQDAAATSFRWDVFLQAGDPESADGNKKGNVPGGLAFAQPDGLVFDRRGVLWILTDSSAQNMATADWARIGNNQMLAADPSTGEVRRFLTGPVGCEIAAVAFAPDQRTMFVSIQHPGEPPKPHPARNDPAKPTAISSWPHGPEGGRPRSALIAIRRQDGGLVGT